MRQDETPTIKFGRDICGNYESATAREWLVTNSIGGYASGTISGVLTRRYHGLLVAALKPPLDRKLLLTKLDETVDSGGEPFDLFANRWVNAVDPHGYQHIENLYLDGTIPVWNFAFADALLEKRIWMGQGENTTYVRYTLNRGAQPVNLTVKALVNYRDHHGETQYGDPMKTELVEHGVKVLARDGAVPFYLPGDKAQAELRNEWYLDFSLAVEQYRGFRGFEDHFFAAEFHVTLQPGETVTIIASTEQNVNLDSGLALRKQKDHESMVLAQVNGRFEKSPASIRQLVLLVCQT